MSRMERVYIDHGAGMPTDPRVLKEMLPYFTEIYGNPSSLHSFGQEALEGLSKARERTAELINSESNEIIFTSGATESNNLALRGVALRRRKEGNEIVISSIEHVSVLNICKILERDGFKISLIPVDSNGIINISALEKAVTDETILASVMYANHEIGTMQPIREIAEIVHRKNAYLHTDAVAAAGFVPIDVRKEGIDLMTLSSNDMYGPKGVGALYVMKGMPIQPIIHGGGQERGLRSGSENIPGIVGMGKAAQIAKKEMPAEAKRLTSLRDEIIREITDSVSDSYLNGHPRKRVPNNANIRFSYVEGESILLGLDMEGIAAASGSACTSKTLEPSHVLLALGLGHEDAHGSVQFTLGRSTTKKDVKHLINIMPGIVDRLRAMSPITPRGAAK